MIRGSPVLPNVDGCDDMQVHNLRWVVILYYTKTPIIP